MDKKFSEVFSETPVWVLGFAEKWCDIGIYGNDAKLYDYQLLCSIITRTAINDIEQEPRLKLKEYYV